MAINQSSYMMTNPAARRNMPQVTGAANNSNYRMIDPGTNWLTGGPDAPSNPNNAAPAAPTPEDLAAQFDFRETPGYDFRFGEGQRAVQNSLIGRGSMLSGRAAKELTRFGQDYGAGEYQNVFNRRAAIAGVAQPIMQQINQAGMGMAGNVGNALMNAGNAQASAYMNQGQSWNNAVQGGIGNYLYADYRGLLD